MFVLWTRLLKLLCFEIRFLPNLIHNNETDKRDQNKNYIIHTGTSNIDDPNNKKCKIL